jgi:chemotaxis protein MotA
MRFSAIGGVAIGLTGIALGVYLDGGNVSQLLQLTAALIVFGGTLGAVVVQFPLEVILDAGRQLPRVFLGESDSTRHQIAQLVHYTEVTRRHGLLALDAELEEIPDSFLRKCLTLAVDGTPVSVLRGVMENELDIRAEREEILPKVFEAAGGFAPTVGILGAVIGLIQVMQRLDNINEVGRGIAVAFVATIYGVGAANLLFLPCAGRVRILVQRDALRNQMALDGVIAVVNRMHPRELETQLSGYLKGKITPTVRGTVLEAR